MTFKNPFTPAWTKDHYFRKMSKDERSLFKRYRTGAKNREYDFRISCKHFTNLIKSRCYYCGTKPFQKHNKLTYMGIDRVDNTKGYILGNVISCCKVCNKAKSSMEFDEFTDWLNLIYEERKLRDKMHETGLGLGEYYISRGVQINPHKFEANENLLEKFKQEEHPRMQSKEREIRKTLVSSTRSYDK